MDDRRLKVYNSFIEQYNELLPNIKNILKTCDELHEDLNGEYLLSGDDLDHKNVLKMRSVILRFCQAAEIILSIKDIQKP